MSTDVLLPKLGFSMSEGQLQEWTVADGDSVTEGQVIYTLESDKATTEIEAPASGTIHITAAVGETYPVGTLLATID